MHRARVLLLVLAASTGCHPKAPPAPPAADPLADREVVPNTEAEPGDVTVCPYSGRKFVVQKDSPTLEYGGQTWVLCSEKARDAVAADPERYLRRP